MHRKTKHQVRVHDFASLAAEMNKRKVIRQVSLRRAITAVVVALVSATGFAMLVRFGFEPMLKSSAMAIPIVLPWWTPMLAANLFGLTAGGCCLWTKAKTVANKQQNQPQKAA